MELLLKREQTQGKIVRVQFKLWGKVELDEEEQKLLDRYKFYDAVLIRQDQPLLLRMSLYVAGAAAAVAFVILALIFEAETALFLALIAGGGAGYWFYNEYRETVIVKDLLLGRYFSCFSIVDLARKEVWVEDCRCRFSPGHGERETLGRDRAAHDRSASERRGSAGHLESPVDATALGAALARFHTRSLSQ